MPSLQKIISASIIILATFSSQVFCNSTLVTNKSELENAMSAAQPGDTIILKDKAWVGITMELTFKGTAEQPIIFRSQTPGGASLESGSRIEIGGDYIVVEGLKFVRGYTTSSPIEFNSGGRDANHCRVTNCLIDNWHPTNTSTKFHWVRVSGSYNQVDHCRFSNMNHSGVTLFVRAGADQPGHHQIDHNYFGPKPEGDGNGYESIKMGGGDYSMYPLHTLVEKNYFYQCDGEVELISNKSWNNTYMHNTFYDCKGTLTLRWGRKCLIEGNYFIGKGRSNTGGIRITDQDHIIVNNYLENITGTDARAAISVMSGIPDTEGGNGGHGQTKNALIAHNTIVNCKQSMNIGYWDDDDLGDPRGDLLPPENCTIANNIIQSSSAPLLTEQWAAPINTSWLTNIGFGASLGMDLDTGWIETDPKLELSADGIMKLTQESPAIANASILSYPVDYDFEMQLRDTTPDIGADEFSDGPGEKLPVQADEVGPDWYTPPIVGVESMQKKLIRSESLDIYPNPAREKFYISLDESFQGKPLHIEIFDTFGRKVYAESFSELSGNPEIASSHLEGLYIVRISCDNRVYQSRILLNK